MKRTKGLAAAVLAAVLAVTLWGCGAADNGSNAGIANNSGGGGAPSLTEAADTAFVDGQAGAQLNATDRKLVYTSSMYIETVAYSDCVAALQAAVQKAGGYVESSYSYGNEEYHSRSWEITVRVPVEQYQSFMQSAKSAGNAIHVQEEIEDITQTYLDVTARLSVMEAERDRLESLLLQAETLEDILTIDARISELQAEIESYTSRLRYMDNQVNYCTVNIEVEETVEYTPQNDSFGTRLVASAKGGLRTLGNTAEALVLGLVYWAPMLVVLGIFLLLVRHLLCSRRRKAAKKQKGGEAPSKDDM